MTDDIVKRLRDAVHYPCSRDFTPRDAPCEACKDREEAADEIERLEAYTALLADEIVRLRAAGDALAYAFRHTGGLDVAYDAPLRAWQEARHG